MPFDGIARTISQEQESASLHRATSTSSARAHPGFPPVAPSSSRPAQIAETASQHSATGSSETAAEERDVESAVPAEKSEKGNAATEADPYLVTMAGREKELSPHYWKESYRWFLTGLAGLLVLNATFASSAPSNLIPSIIKHYNVSEEVGVLLISIFVAGYMVGPLVWGPLSERYGRKKILAISFVPYTLFQMASALSPNIGSLIVFRFLGGISASSPLSISGAYLSDIWQSDKRGDAIAIFSLMPFAGPALAPIISGFMEVTNTDFRWIFWVLTIFAGVCLIIIVVVMPETYAPYILHQEAKRLRKETGDDRWHDATELKKETFGAKLSNILLKPFRMIVQEPMLALLTLYMSFIYGLIYLLFEAVPIIFQGQHGLNGGEAGLIFLALLAGGVIGVLMYIFYFNPRYVKKHKAIAPKMVSPEVRLEPMLYSAPALAIAFFWMGWTAYPSISIASPILAICLLGITVLLLFLSIFNYLIDTYLMNAASALAINTVCRSAFGAGFPLFATQMYKKLGVPGASSLLGGLAIVFIPAPFLLAKYGKKIRMMSKNAVVLD